MSERDGYGPDAVLGDPQGAVFSVSQIRRPQGA